MEGHGERRSTAATVAGLFALALALRVVHQVTMQGSPFLSILYIDPLMYDDWARRIAGGAWLSERPFFLDPLYPYFLGAVYRAFGPSHNAAIAVQGLLGACVAPLVFLSARRWFDRTTALVAGIVAAIYLPGIYFGSLIMKPGLSVFLSALLLWMLAVALDRRRGAGWWAGIGVVFAMGSLTRGNLVPLIPLVAAALWLAERTRRRSIEVACLLGGAALVLWLPAWHNYRVGGEWILTTANAGANFYIGNNKTNTSGEYQQLPFIRANPKYEQLDFAAEARRRSGREMSDAELSRFWFDETWEEIGEAPGHWVGLLWTKLRGFWGAYEIPDSVDYRLFAEYAPLLRLPLPGFGLLGALALTGIALSWRRSGWPRLLIVFVAAYCATVVFFFVFSRFRMVVMPALYVFAACGAVELVRRWRAGSRRPAALATLAFVAAFAFVNLPVRARTDSWAYRVAAALPFVPTVPETSAQGHYNLGVALAAEAKRFEDDDPRAARELLERAEAELRRVLALRGDGAFAVDHVELGKVLAREGRPGEALESYAAAARLEPGNYRTYHAMGLLYEEAGDPLRAAQAYQQAIRVEPRFVPSAVKLGEVLLEMNRPQDAAIAFGHALDQSPDNAGARAGLARARAAAQLPREDE